MSDREKEVAPANLQQDLNLSATSSEEEASDAGGAEEAVMEQDLAPPAGPEAVASTAAPASKAPDDRQPPEEAKKEPAPPYACTQCSYTSLSRANLKTHVRRRHTNVDVMWECGECRKSYQRRDYLTRHQAAISSCRGATATMISGAGAAKTQERVASRQRVSPQESRLRPPCRRRRARSPSVTVTRRRRPPQAKRYPRSPGQGQSL